MDKLEIKSEEIKDDKSIEEGKHKLFKSIFKLIDIHPEVSAIKMSNTEKDTKPEIYGMRVDSSNFNNEKGTYNYMMDTIKDLLSREENSEETNNKLLELLDKVREDIKELETNKNESPKNVSSIVKFAGCTLLSIGASLGTVFIMKNKVDKN